MKMYKSLDVHLKCLCAYFSHKLRLIWHWGRHNECSVMKPYYSILGTGLMTIWAFASLTSRFWLRQEKLSAWMVVGSNKGESEMEKWPKKKPLVCKLRCCDSCPPTSVSAFQGGKGGWGRSTLLCKTGTLEFKSPPLSLLRAVPGTWLHPKACKEALGSIEKRKEPGKGMLASLSWEGGAVSSWRLLCYTRENLRPRDRNGQSGQKAACVLRCVWNSLSCHDHFWNHLCTSFPFSSHWPNYSWTLEEHQAALKTLASTLSTLRSGKGWARRAVVSSIFLQDHSSFQLESEDTKTRLVGKPWLSSWKEMLEVRNSRPQQEGQQNRNRH